MSHGDAELRARLRQLGQEILEATGEPETLVSSPTQMNQMIGLAERRSLSSSMYPKGTKRTIRLIRSGRPIASSVEPLAKNL